MTFVRVLIFAIAISLLPAQTKPPAPPPGVVHIYRLKLTVGVATHPTVSCDNFPVVRMQNGRVYTMKASVGRHLFSTTERPTGLTVDVESGKEYFVRVDYPLNASDSSGATAVLVPAEQGRMETMDLRPLDARWIEAATCGG